MKQSMPIGLAALGVCLALAGCGTEQITGSSAAQPPASSPDSTCVRDGAASDTAEYRSVADLADASASVIQGTVTSKGPGARSGEDTFMEYGIRTDEVLAGPDMPASFALRTGYINGDGCEVSFNGVGTMDVGQHAVIFAVPAGGAPSDVYSAVGTQGRFQVDGDAIGRTRRSDDLTRRVEAGTATALRQAIRASKRGRPAS